MLETSLKSTRMVHHLIIVASLTLVMFSLPNTEEEDYRSAIKELNTLREVQDNLPHRREQVLQQAIRDYSRGPVPLTSIERARHSYLETALDNVAKLVQKKQFNFKDVDLKPLKLWRRIREGIVLQSSNDFVIKNKMRNCAVLEPIPNNPSLRHFLETFDQVEVRFYNVAIEPFKASLLKKLHKINLFSDDSKIIETQIAKLRSLDQRPSIAPLNTVMSIVEEIKNAIQNIRDFKFIEIRTHSTHDCASAKQLNFEIDYGKPDGTVLGTIYFTSPLDNGAVVRNQISQDQVKDNIKKIHLFIDKIGNLPLDIAQHRLKSDLQQTKGKWHFSGLTIDKRSLRYFGPTIIIVVFFYFAMLLIHLVSIIRDEADVDMASRFPWFALFEQKPASMAAYLSISILPVISTAIMSFNFDNVNVIDILLLITVLLFSAWTALRLFRLRLRLWKK